MSKSSEDSNLPIVKAVIINGPNIFMYPEILQFMNKTGVVFVGDGIKAVTIKNIQKALENYQITSETNFYLRAHGRRGRSNAPEDSKKHFIGLEPKKVKLTEEFFRELHQAFGDGLTLETSACHGAAANKAAPALGKNSVLITHVPSKHRSSALQGNLEMSKSIREHLNDAALTQRINSILLRGQPFTIVPVLNDINGNIIKFKAPRIAKNKILESLTAELKDKTKNIETIVNIIINKNIEDFQKGPEGEKIFTWVKERYSENEADNIKNFKMNASYTDAEIYLYGMLNYLITGINQSNKQQVLDFLDIYHDRNLSLNKKDFLPGVLLDMAVSGEEKSIVTKLLKLGADPNLSNLTPLTYAVQKNNLDIVKLLLQYQADINRSGDNNATPLLYAIDKNHLEIANYLLAKGADVNLMSNNGITPLSLAISKENLDCVKILLDKGADVNKLNNDGTPPLLPAIGENNLDVVRLLVDKGANVNWASKNGTSILHEAVSFCSVEVIKELLDNKASINHRRDNGETPLMLATYRNDTEYVKLLLSYGADPTLKNQHGRTALDYARKFDDKEMQQILGQTLKKQSWQEKVKLSKSGEKTLGI